MTGMEVTDSCHVTGFVGEGSVAEAARVPIPSRIVEVFHSQIPARILFE